MTILLFVMALTAMSLIGAIVIPMFGTASVAQTDVAIDNLWKTFFSGFSAFIGMAGGKAI